MDTKKRLLPLGGMARRLSVTTRWLKAEADAGKIPCVKAGERYLFEPDTVTAILVRRAKGGDHAA